MPVIPYDQLWITLFLPIVIGVALFLVGWIVFMVILWAVAKTLVEINSQLIRIAAFCELVYTKYMKGK